MSDSGTFKVNPIHDAQQRALAAEAICQDILTGARNQLYLNMRFLDSALAALPFVGEILWERMETCCIISRKN